MACKLSVNLNKIALIRNARGHNYPSIEHFAHTALAAGAHGVTIHPRPDQRHARYADIAALAEVVRNFQHAELNVEGYPNEAFLREVLAVVPAQCTLVPDAPDQLTSDHGWNLSKDGDFLAKVITQLKQAGIRSSIFMDPDLAQIELAPKTGAQRIELYTEAYAAHPGRKTIEPYLLAAQRAVTLGMGVNAGHDLNLANLLPFLSAIPEIEEVSIGHALTVEALELGFVHTIERYVDILHQASR